MTATFAGKRAIVTGASRGIGRGIAEALCKAGAEVWNLDLIPNDIPGIKTIQVDLRDLAVLTKVLEEIGAVDYLVNNAGINLPPTLFIDSTRDMLNDVIDINLKAPFTVSQIVTRAMIENGKGGSIVHIASIAGLRPVKDLGVYSISKAGLSMLTKVMALELGTHKIRVNSVCPTGVRTELSKAFMDDPDFYVPFIARHPLGKVAEINDVANAVLFLLSDEASMITGTNLPVDGGVLVS